MLSAPLTAALPAPGNGHTREEHARDARVDELLSRLDYCLLRSLARGTGE